MTDTAEERDLLAPHDLGCRCYPHVSQRDAAEAIVQAVTHEYRAARAADHGLREAVILALGVLGTMGNGEGWTIADDVILPLWAALPPEDRERTGYDTALMKADYERVRKSRGYPPLAARPAPTAALDVEQPEVVVYCPCRRHQVCDPHQHDHGDVPSRSRCLSHSGSSSSGGAEAER